MSTSNYSLGDFNLKDYGLGISSDLYKPTNTGTDNPWGVGFGGRTNSLTDDLSLNTDLDFLKKEKPGFFKDTLGIGTVADGLGLASSMYSDYLKGKYLNKAMDAMDYNLKAAKKADNTHYNNAAGFDNYSSKRAV